METSDLGNQNVGQNPGGLQVGNSTLTTFWNIKRANILKFYSIPGQSQTRNIPLGLRGSKPASKCENLSEGSFTLHNPLGGSTFGGETINFLSLHQQKKEDRFFLNLPWGGGHYFPPVRRGGDSPPYMIGAHTVGAPPAGAYKNMTPALNKPRIDPCSNVSIHPDSRPSSTHPGGRLLYSLTTREELYRRPSF